MSTGVDEGCYYIYNRVLSPTGEKLAVTYKEDSDNGVAILTPFDKTETKQQWHITYAEKPDPNYYGPPTGLGSAQFIRPVANSGVEAGMGDAGVQFYPVGTYLIWDITKSDNGYSIQSHDKSVTWEASDAEDGTNVNLGADDTGLARQRWVLGKIPSQ